MRFSASSIISALVLCLLAIWGAVEVLGLGEVRLNGKPASYYFPDEQVEALVTAAAEGDVPAMKAAVEAGADVNYAGIEDIRPLLWPMYAKNKVGFEALLELGADPKLHAKDNFSLINVAAGGDDPDYLRMILDHGFDPNTPLGRKEEPAIFEAIMQNRWPQLKMLLEYCYNLNWADEFGITAAIDAVSISEMKMAHYLVEQGLRHNFVKLARFTESNRRNPPEQAEYREKLMNLLEEEHGLTFPAPKRKPGRTFLPPSPPAYAQSCLDRQERLGLGPPDGVGN